MKIHVDCIGSEYLLMPAFEAWLSRELRKRIKTSAYARKKYGNDSTLCFHFFAEGYRKRPRVNVPFVYHSSRKVEWSITVRDVGAGLGHPKHYVLPFRQFVEGIATVLRRLEIDVSRLRKDLPLLTKQFASNPKMVGKPGETPVRKQGRPLLGYFETDFKWRPEKTPVAGKRKLPQWRIPRNIAKLAEKEGGMWESERFDPILLVVWSETASRGRKAALSWEIQFDPYDGPFQKASAKIKASGTEPDGDAWAEFIEKEFARHYPKRAPEIQSDSEMSTCVLRVESEDTCRKLIELVWSMIYPNHKSRV